jgi:transposase
VLQAKGVTGKTCLHIDEIAVKKGHSNFETIIYTDQEILETMSGKKSVDLQSLLKNIPGIGTIQQVCMDMCASFADAVRTTLPHVEIVTDRFHLTKLLNKTLDQLRLKTGKKMKQERFRIEESLKSLENEERQCTKELKSLQKEGGKPNHKKLKRFRKKQSSTKKERRRLQEIQTNIARIHLKIAELEKELKEIELKEKRFSHIRFLLGKDYEELNRDERRLVVEYLRFNTEIKVVYWLCQDFREILFSEKPLNKEEADIQLSNWCNKAQEHLGRFVKTLKTWWKEVLNACIYPLNNGRAEGFNNKIKMIKRMGFGFRNRLNFKLRIQAACNP